VTRRFGVAASLAAVTLAGCSGGNEPSGTYEAADAERLAAVAPRTPGWRFSPRAPEPKQPSDDSLEDRPARDPIYAEYRRRTPDIQMHDEWGSSNKWADDDKLANLVAGVSASAADAHVEFNAANDLSQG